MIKRILSLLPCVLLLQTVWAQEVILKAKMKITRSVKVKKNLYSLAGNTANEYVILIEGNDIVVDFNNATIVGANPALIKPDMFAGICILVKNSRNVTIKNLKARGYKIAFRAVGVEKLTLDNCDFSYNYRKLLNSTQEKEDVSDWMSYHQNEKDEWLRYGAAMYIRNCNFLLVKNCKVTGGQNALMMTGCNNGRVFNNDFSFNSGIGIGIYRSSGNHFLNNKLNFNVRGYSHGVYQRGQDSAGFLVYEQCNYNVFYKNSATHSGDGFFLWAGQTTMDTGKGGCNNNFISQNDFSYAPTNGIEVTFSTNVITHNRIYECDHGIWGGYSYNTVISNNHFRDNRIGIAIEHGQENRIDHNLFSGDKEAIRLWARKEQPADWGYAKNRDTRSRDYEIVYNSFNRNPITLNVTRTENIHYFGNTVSDTGLIVKLDSTVTGLDTTEVEEIKARYQVDSTSVNYDAPRPNDPFIGNGTFKGRKNIMITEWGPYDFRYPYIRNTNPTAAGDTMQFDILGPPGKWKIKKIKGVDQLSAMQGVFPASVTARKIKDIRTDIIIELEFTGQAFTNAFGETIPQGKIHTFRFSKYFQPMDWEVNWYSLDTVAHNPVRTGMLFSMYEKKAPFKTERSQKLDYAWWGGIKQGGNQYPQFITTADSEVNMVPGNYELSVTWDDAVRIYLDDKLILNEWTPSRYKFDESPNRKIRLRLGGKHRFRVEHVELGGFACLSLKFKPI